MCELMKKCFACKQDKSTALFHKDSRAPDGLYSTCRICYSLKRKEQRALARLNRPSKQAPVPLTEKACTKCKAVLPLAAFSPDKKQRGGCRPRCRACERERFKFKQPEWHEEERARIRRWTTMSTLTLTDNYITRLLSRGGVLKAENTPKALIEVKRLQITILRTVRDSKDE